MMATRTPNSAVYVASRRGVKVTVPFCLLDSGRTCHLIPSVAPINHNYIVDLLLSSVLACPHCAQPLSLAHSGATCPHGHSFDRAKEGYLNLLVGGRVASTKTPGDSPESLAARRRFLHAGWYSPIIDAMRSVLSEVNGPLLDVGCGEGYYLSCLDHDKTYALDISKRAIQMTSKLLPSTQCVVGTSFRLPVQNESLGGVYTVFAPHSIDEYLRVLQEGGTWATVTPGPHHLVELRPHRDEKIIEREDRRTQPPAQTEHAERVQFTLNLTDDAAHDLVAMTPLQFQASAHTAVDLVRTVSVDVWVSTGRKHR